MGFLVQIMNDPEIVISEADGIRQLHFGSEWVQGAMRLNDPLSLELDYLKDMLTPLLLHDNKHWPKRILIIGLGAASLTRFLVKYYTKAHIDTVEISPSVLSVCKSCFYLPEESSRFKVHISCGIEYLKTTLTRYDLILVDAFDESAENVPFTTPEFFQLVLDRLTAMGGFAINLHSFCRPVNTQFNNLLKMFGENCFLLSKTKEGNQIGCGFSPSTVWPSHQLLLARLAQMEQKCKIDLTSVRLKAIRNQ